MRIHRALTVLGLGVDNMTGVVIVVFKIIPDGIESFAAVKSAVEKFEPKKVEEEEVAFGLKAVKATFLVPEIDGKMDELEDNLNSIEHVGGVEVVGMSRSL